jgi:hypothetical protein
LNQWRYGRWLVSGPGLLDQSHDFDDNGVGGRTATGMGTRRLRHECLGVEHGSRDYMCICDYD